jgi:hypothetical protein
MTGDKCGKFPWEVQAEELQSVVHLGDFRRKSRTEIPEICK